MKEIIGLIENILPLSEKEKQLAEKMQQLYLCPMGECVKCLIPPEGNKGRSCNFTLLTIEPDQVDSTIAQENFRNISQIKVLEYLRDCGGKAPYQEIMQNVNCSVSVLKTL